MNEQPAEDKEKGRRLVNKIIKFYGVLFALVGAFLLLKDKFLDFDFLGAPTDLYLGGALFVVGIFDCFIAEALPSLYIQTQKFLDIQFTIIYLFVFKI